MRFLELGMVPAFGACFFAWLLTVIKILCLPANPRWSQVSPLALPGAGRPGWGLSLEGFLPALPASPSFTFVLVSALLGYQHLPVLTSPLHSGPLNQQEVLIRLHGSFSSSISAFQILKQSFSVLHSGPPPCARVGSCGI